MSVSGWRAAGERLAGGLLGIVQRALLVLAVLELAGAQHALARAARAVAAAVGQADALAQRRLEDGLPGRDGERVAARLESDLAGCRVRSAQRVRRNSPSMNVPGRSRCAHGLDDEARAGQQQQREGDEVGDHAGKDQEEAGEHGARAIGERARSAKRPWAKPAARRATSAKRASLMSAMPATGGEHHPREDPPAQRLAQPHQHDGFEQGETQ